MSYRFRASNGKGHGVHSPFVFEFITQVLNDKKKYPCYDSIENQRRSLLQNRTSIEVQDFGAGSTRLKSTSRRIDQIAASSLKPKKYAQLLFRIVHYYQPDTILELGTSLGITTAYLASASPTARLITLEGAPAIAHPARQFFSEAGLQNIQLMNGDFAGTLPQALSALPQVGLAFIDGNHRKEPTLQYFQQLLSHISEHSILIFDDIHWSAEMEAAWEEIKKEEAVTLTIDLFFIGIVFFRRDFKAKQHFSILF